MEAFVLFCVALFIVTYVPMIGFTLILSASIDRLQARVRALEFRTANGTK